MKIFKRLVDILFVVAILLTFTAGISIKSEDVMIHNVGSKTEGLNIAFSEGWEYPTTGEPVRSEGRLDVAPGEVLIIENTLPEGIVTDNVLAFYDTGLKIYGYIDGECVYSSGVDGNRTYGKEIGSVWKVFRLQPEYSGKQLILALENDSDVNLFINMDTMRVANEANIVNRVVITSRNALILTYTCLLISIVSLVLAVMIRRKGFRTESREMWAFSIINFFASIWIFSDSNMLQLVTSNSSLRYMLSNLSLIILPVCLVNLFRQISDEKLSYGIVKYTYEFIEIICLGFYAHGLVPLSDMRFIVHTGFVVIALFIGYSALESFKAEHNVRNFGRLLSFSIILVFLVIALTMRYITNSNKVSIYVGGAFVAFMIVMILTEIWGVVARVYRPKTQNS